MRALLFDRDGSLAPRMSAIACYFDQVLVGRLFAMIAAVFDVACYATTAYFMSAFTFVCHIFSLPGF